MSTLSGVGNAALWGNRQLGLESPTGHFEIETAQCKLVLMILLYDTGLFYII